MTFCRIQFVAPDGSTFARAATVVARNVLLTAKHHIDDRQAVRVDAGDGTPQFPGVVIHCGHDDLAIVVMEVDLPGASPIAIAQARQGSGGTLEAYVQPPPKAAANVRTVGAHLHYEADGRGRSGFALVQAGTLVGVQSRHVSGSTFSACRAVDALDCIGSALT